MKESGEGFVGRCNEGDRGNTFKIVNHCIIAHNSPVLVKHLNAGINFGLKKTLNLTNKQC